MENRGAANTREELGSCCRDFQQEKAISCEVGLGYGKPEGKTASAAANEDRRQETRREKEDVSPKRCPHVVVTLRNSLGSHF